VHAFTVDIHDILIELEYVTKDLLVPAEVAVGRWVGYPWAPQMELDAYN